MAMKAGQGPLVFSGHGGVGLGNGMGQQGRLVIPAEIRSALGLSPGDQFHLRLVGHSLVLERPRDAASELRGMASQVPRTRSLVDELLSERRHAAAVGE